MDGKPGSVTVFDGSFEARRCTARRRLSPSAFLTGRQEDQEARPWTREFSGLFACLQEYKELLKREYFAGAGIAAGKGRKKAPAEA